MADGFSTKQAEAYTATGAPLLDFQPRPLWQVLAASVRQFPDRTALIFKDTKISYAELGELVRIAAAGLQQHGIRPGDRIGICMPNHPVSVIMLFATMRVGAIIVMMSPIYAEPALTGQAKDADLSMLITLDVPTLRDKVESVATNADVPTVIVASPDATQLQARKLEKTSAEDEVVLHLSELLAGNADPAVVPCDPTTDLAVIQYSGGTTGSPKGVMLTHANLHTGIRQLHLTLPMIGYGTDTILAAAPFFHISGMNAVLMPALAWAATIIIIDRFEAADTARSCISNAVTYFVAVPTMFIALTDITEKLSLKWTHLKCALSAGAPLPEPVKTRFEAIVGKPLLHAYGLTECSPPVSMPPLDRSVPVASCGQVVPGAQIQIRSVSNVSEVLPAGKIGELCVRGPQVTPGYWRRPGMNNEIFVDGFIRTGDLAYIAEDGLLYLVDRLKDIIICSGFNVYPTRVEEAIYQHPSVSEAIVLGVSDPYRGETVKAFISVCDRCTLTLEELQRFLAPLLSPIEIPKQLELRDQLPRSPVGKLSRLKLRDEVMNKDKA